MWTPPKPQTATETSDEARDQNTDPGTVPAVTWDGSSKGTVPLLGTDRTPTRSPR